MIINQLPNALLRQIRVNRGSAETKQRREMMHFPRLRRLQYDCDARSFFRVDKMLLQRRYRQKRRNRHAVLIHAPVGQNQDIDAAPERSVNLYKQPVNRLFQTCVFIIGNRHDFCFESFRFHALYFKQIRVCQNRIVYFEHVAVLRFFL